MYKFSLFGILYLLDHIIWIKSGVAQSPNIMWMTKNFNLKLHVWIKGKIGMASDGRSWSGFKAEELCEVLKKHGVLSKAAWRFGMWTWIHYFEERHHLLKATKPQ
jgi:hypothetical protein